MSTKYSSIEMQAAIEAEVSKWYKLGIELFPQPEKRIELEYDLKGTTAGRAHTRKKAEQNHLIEWNMKLALENQDRFLNQTVPHEVAHLVADMFFHDIRPMGCEHGELWALVMMKFGRPAEQYHDYDCSHVEHVRYAKYDADVV